MMTVKEAEAFLRQTEATSAQVAKFLGVSPRTLSYWRSQGTGPMFVRYGLYTVRYNPRQVYRWKLEHRHE